MLFQDKAHNKALKIAIIIDGVTETPKFEGVGTGVGGGVGANGAGVGAGVGGGGRIKGGPKAHGLGSPTQLV